MSEFNTFFDAPAKRPHESYRSRLDRKRFRNWTIHEPGITAAIVGARTADQAVHNAGALKFALTPDEREEVRRAFDPWSPAAS
jgi:hypothetical protein